MDSTSGSDAVCCLKMYSKLKAETPHLAQSMQSQEQRVIDDVQATHAVVQA